MEKGKRTSDGSVPIIIFLLILVILLILGARYILEDTKKCPFVLSEIITVSTAEGIRKTESVETWELSLMQNNDVYIYINHDETAHNNRAKLKKLTIQNFKIVSGPETAKFEFYMPSANQELEFEVKDEYLVKDKIEFIRNENSIFNIKDYSAMIGFRQVAKDVGEYLHTGEEIVQDGKLLQLAGITEEQLKSVISFEIVIETTQSVKYMTNVTVEVPAKDLIENGMGAAENTNLENIVFEKI